MDGEYPRRIPDGSRFYYAGIIVDFTEDQFDKHIVSNDPPGDGPAASSGDCNYNFTSVEWTSIKGVLVNTQSPVPVCYLADARHPAGLPGYPENVLTIVGSTNLTISVLCRELRTLTFLVGAANTEGLEIFDMILYYREFGLDATPFFLSPELSPPCGPPCGVQEHLDKIPRQDSIVVAAIHTTLVPPPVKRVTTFPVSDNCA